MTAIFNKDWVDWIDTNVQRGCSDKDIVSQLAQHGFAESQAVNALFTRRDALARVAPALQPRWGKSGGAVVLNDRVVHVRFSCNSHRVVLLDNVLSDEEASALINLALGRLSQSDVVDPETGGSTYISERSSYGGCFERAETSWVKRIEERIASVLGVNVDQAERMQFLRYGVGQEYEPHFDFFQPCEPGGLHLLQSGGQRVATVILYLNDVYKGGATVFPNLDISIYPAKGSALIFLQHDELGLLDENVLHGGAPVEEGEKWIATLWFHDKLTEASAPQLDSSATRQKKSKK